MLAQGEISQRDMQTRRPHAAAEGGRRPPAGDSRARALLRQLREAAVDRAVRNPASVRRRPRCAIDDRPPVCRSYARQAIESILKEPNGPSAALVVDPAQHRRGVWRCTAATTSGRASSTSAVQGERQPGSSFKPFVLATALKEGISPATTFPSKPVSIFIGDKYWPVHNYENDYIGSADLTTATVVSDNTRLRAADPARRAGQRRRDGATSSASPGI